MLNNTKRIKEIYEEIQRKIFYLIPEKWEEVYLYASVIDRLGKFQTGEMYFYFLPKNLFKNKYVNVYEIPDKYNLEEKEYLMMLESLYDKIKELREEFIKTQQLPWSNLTVSIKNNRFKIEYNYDSLVSSQDFYYQHHIFWRYKYLHIEPHGKKEKQALESYLLVEKNARKKDEKYETGLYLKKINNIITYDTLDFKEHQRNAYMENERESKKIKNQILSD